MDNLQLVILCGGLASRIIKLTKNSKIIIKISKTSIYILSVKMGKKK